VDSPGAVEAGGAAAFRGGVPAVLCETSRVLAALRTLALLTALAAAGCATTSDTWGGYTENEAKEILALPNVRDTIIETSIRTEGQTPVSEIYPTEQELQETDLRKVTLTGQEAWEYADTPNFFCLYVWEDPETQTYFAQSSQCVAD
jgi:hypothetical protein